MRWTLGHGLLCRWIAFHLGGAMYLRPVPKVNLIAAQLTSPNRSRSARYLRCLSLVHPTTNRQYKRASINPFESSQAGTPAEVFPGIVEGFFRSAFLLNGLVKYRLHNGIEAKPLESGFGFCCIGDRSFLPAADRRRRCWVYWGCQ